MKNFQFYTICSLTFITEPCASGFTVSDHMIKPDVMEKQSNSCPISSKYIICNETYNNVCDAHTIHRFTHKYSFQNHNNSSNNQTTASEQALGNRGKENLPFNKKKLLAHPGSGSNVSNCFMSTKLSGFKQHDSGHQ